MTKSDLSTGSTLSAIFLVAGTCIGGGMLALPVATGVNGFFPSVALMLFCWAAMTSSALLLLEVSLWMEDGVHFITMTSRLLGPLGKGLSWILYLFIAYASIIAYTAAGGMHISDALQGITGIFLSKGWSCLIFILLFGILIDFGARIVGKINGVLFCAMIISFFLLIFSGVTEVKAEYLLQRNWSGSFIAIPILLTAFSHQTMVPSLTHYLRRNPSSMRWAVVGGTTIALTGYVVWLWFVMGVVPIEGEYGLANALAKGDPATFYIRESVSAVWIGVVAEYFAFFAIVTSFLGMVLGLFDFLSDGLKIEKKGAGKLVLAAIIIAPTLFFSVFFERIFLLAIDTTGGVGDTLLNGIIPILMVWVGRYYLKYSSQIRLPGGRLALTVLFLFFLISFLIECSIHLGIAPSFYDVTEQHVL